MITRSKRNYIDYLSDHKEDEAEGAPAVAEEVLRARTESKAKRCKPTLWKEAADTGNDACPKEKDQGEQAPAPPEKEDEGKRNDKTLQTWIRYAQVLEYIADKEIVSRAYALFHKKMKENQEFMQKAHETFSAKNKDTSARAKSQLFCRHVQTMSHTLFHQAQDIASDLVTHTKEKCFEKTMKLFALESGMTRL